MRSQPSLAQRRWRRAARGLVYRLARRRCPRHPLLGALLGYRCRGSLTLDRVGRFGLAYDVGTQIGATLFTAGGFEEAELAIGAWLLGGRTGAVILDVGANIGVHALSWAALDPTYRVHAWEPARGILPVLERNLAANALAGQVTVERSAASDRTGNIEFVETADPAYSGVRDTLRVPVRRRVTVPCLTIDDFAARRGLGRVDLIKIDVEGHEASALAGAAATLDRFRPRLMVEIFGGAASNPDPDGTVRWVIARGYDAYVLFGGRLEPFTTHDDSRFNYVFTPRT